MKISVRWMDNELLADDARVLAFILEKDGGNFVGFRLTLNLSNGVIPKAAIVEVCEDKTLEKAKQAVELILGLGW